MSLQQETRPQVKPQTPAAPVAKARSGVPPVLAAAAGVGALGDAPRRAGGAAGWSGARTRDDDATPASPGATRARNLAPVVKQAQGSAAQVAPALEAAARGESVAEQAQRVRGPVKMTAASALAIAGQMSDAEAARAAYREQNSDRCTYETPFVSIGLSGIQSNQGDAEELSKNINGDASAHGYAAYGSNKESYASELGPGQGGINSPGAKKGEVDALNDTAAVTQYAAAAQLGVTLKVDAKGGGKQVQVDWAALDKMEVSADMGALGGKIKYDSPGQVANNGYQAVMAEIASRNGNPEDKKQMISLTGHSGGGQSSFYTALKLASEGYGNISLVGVDMAMTPHEREVLETLGVKVTNITSHTQGPGLGGVRGPDINSPIGEGIRVGMGGGSDYYDLNVQRQTTRAPWDMDGLHSMQNDANVATTVRFAQYLDAIGQHGEYSDALYKQFLKDTGEKGDNYAATGTEADKDLMSKIGAPQDGKKKSGSPSLIESAIGVMGKVAPVVSGAGKALHNGFDKVGDFASSIFGGIGKASKAAGGVANSWLDSIGSGLGAVGSFIGNGIDKAGDFVQSGAQKVAGGVSTLGRMANQGLDAVGNGVRSVGSTIGNGLDKAGDTARSWLGGIPLVGGFLGNAVDSGLDALGGGVSTVGNFIGNGFDKGGDVVQAGATQLAGGVNAAGAGANRGLDAVAGGVKTAGNTLNSGFDKAGDGAQTAFNTVGSAANKAGGAVNTALDRVGLGFHIAGTALSGVPVLQAMGIDTSQIDDLSYFQQGAPSNRRNWESLLTQDKSDTSKVQTIDAPVRAEPAVRSGGSAGLDGHMGFLPGAMLGAGRTDGAPIYAD